ncbi:MAG: lamin tail domain-containing protein, partial [Bacteroidota bacterium]
MKKLFFLMVAIMISATTTLGQATDLFISEYAEGSSYNKYIEIYNGTGAPVDLTIYELKIGSNGNLMENSVTLEGTLEDGGVYVVSHAQASDEILAIANLTSSSVINFNGNDALGLFKDGTLIDVIGVEGENPGVAWMVAGVEGTIDHTLIRKPDVCSPTTDWTASAGT